MNTYGILDIGASTGGFVDCLLQHGALKVIAVDVGRGQLHSRLQEDPRVYVIDKANARYLTPAELPYEPDFLTMDVSFISVSKVLPAVFGCMAARFEGLVLIKPQFEAGRNQVGKNGIVRDREVHRAVLLERGRSIIEAQGIQLVGVCRSGLPGTDGNREFFFRVGRGGENALDLDTLEQLIEDLLIEDAGSNARPSK